MQTEQCPLVLQFNKRDLRSILPVEQLNSTLNAEGVPYFEAAALHGIGVFETLKAISRQALSSIRRKLAAEEAALPKQTPTAAAPAGRAAPPLPRPLAEPTIPIAAERVAALTAPPAPTAAATNPLAELVTVVPPAEDLPVEFAEEDTDKHSVRPVRTKERLDIQDELAKLRTLAGVPASGAGTKAPAPSGAREVEKRLQDVIGTVAEYPSRLEVKRKASVVVPSDVLRNSSVMKVRISFDGDEQWAQDAVTVHLTSNRKLDRLNVHLELDLKGKTS
jgi:hypothetical protein